MRWRAQHVGEQAVGDAPVLPGLSGLLRSVRTPEFDGVVFHEVEARSALNRVPGSSQVPFEWTVNPYRGCSHACTYCLAGETAVLTADGRTKPIAELRVGDGIYGTVREGTYRRYALTEVLAHWSTVKPAYRITLADGTELVASGDHRFLTERGWKHVTGQMGGPGQRPYLTAGNSLLGTGRFAAQPEHGPQYRLGYLCGVVRDRVGRRLVDLEAVQRSRRFLARCDVPLGELIVQEVGGGRGAVSGPGPGRGPGGWPEAPDDQWCRGFLAGIYDAEGSYSRGILRIPHRDGRVVEQTAAALRRFGFDFTVEDGGRSNGLRCIRLLGGLPEQLRLFHSVDPAVTRKRSITGRAIKTAVPLDVVSVEPLGMQLPMYDITTGTGDFIADGVVSHNCFARNTHTYLDLDAGQDFNSQIVVKVNVARVLERELRSPRWGREQVAMGTNTDPYQRAEGRYRLMPGIVAALARSGTPFSVLTKGTMLTRDLPLLVAAAKDVPVGLGVSIALTDRELQANLEPGTPSPPARLEMVRRIRETGLPCGVMVAPVLPLLTDSEEALDDLLGKIAATGATGATVLALHLRKGTREWFLQWLARELPELVEPYRALYRRGAYVDPEYRRALAERTRPLLRRHGLAGGAAAGLRAAPGIPAGPRAERPGGDQLTLL